ncbi:hypothetical protein P3X46_000645 [Hevea brasiliensis]|uniref:VWFA domain-containing protein n=1 Tax=Hevea brasiliensis TaxID=3981 RepID=A0ABQ9N9Y9_HEVBR|nr:hypothetical protein P3X46_000645 [Hevea brasiliensis]
MRFNDDEKIVSSQESGSKPTPIVPGRVQLISINKNIVPLEESKLRVMLEITGGDSSNNRPGLDLVAVLDVSGSMEGEKIAKVKTAMLFVIKKLSPIDRLSIVPVANELESLINGLNAHGNTNICAGLQIGLKVINDRSLSGGRSVGIMLMSDGQQNAGGDAATVPVGDVPVHTFGFGINHEPKMLVDDLKLTVTRIEDESTIEQVIAGNYPQSKDDAAGSVTVTFGGLYTKEVRKVIVDLLLSAVDQERGADILEITYSYSFHGKPFEANPAILTVRRTGKAADQQERSEVKNEETRLLTASMMKEARVMADSNKLDDARDKLVEAQNSLEDVDDESNPLIEMLRFELQQFLKLMKSQEIYDKQGRPFALSCEISHDRQRFAARGDIECLRLFATPCMDKYLEQAKSFDEDPSKPLPSVDDDVKEELAANPLAPIAGAISFYIQSANQSLQAIEKIINGGL